MLIGACPCTPWPSMSIKVGACQSLRSLMPLITSGDAPLGDLGHKGQWCPLQARTIVHSLATLMGTFMAIR